MDLITVVFLIRPSGGLKGEENFKKIRGIFNLRMGDRILMKFDI